MCSLRDEGLSVGCGNHNAPAGLCQTAVSRSFGSLTASRDRSVDLFRVLNSNAILVAEGVGDPRRARSLFRVFLEHPGRHFG